MGELLDELVDAARRATAPSIPLADGLPRPGGVDPLGLRQLNFDLMDAVLPGVNNVARRVRPYVVVAWAARRARHLSEADKAPAVPSMIRDFIDRIEVVFALSQFLQAPGSIPGLPGRVVLQNHFGGRTYRFGGEGWETFRKNRAGSTAFTAAITYGPSIKALDWAGPTKPPAWGASSRVDKALDAFEAKIASLLDHPVFSRFGTVTANSKEVEAWGQLWPLDYLTAPEQKIFADSLAGEGARPPLRRTMILIRDILAEAPELTLAELSAAMSKRAGDDPARIAWRRLQVRQTFRLALEAWFFWCLLQLEQGPLSSADLVERFRAPAGGWAASDKPGGWLELTRAHCPVDLQARLTTALKVNRTRLPREIQKALAFCFTEIDEAGDTVQERYDRLPLRRARSEARSWADATPADFLTHMLQSWLFAQHAYWSAGRGLADARSGGGGIMRLRVALDDGGWRLTRLGSRRSQPYPTEDRLETVCRLGTECGLFDD